MAVRHGHDSSKHCRRAWPQSQTALPQRSGQRGVNSPRQPIVAVEGHVTRFVTQNESHMAPAARPVSGPSNMRGIGGADQAPVSSNTCSSNRTPSARRQRQTRLKSQCEVMWRPPNRSTTRGRANASVSGSSATKSQHASLIFVIGSATRSRSPHCQWKRNVPSRGPDPPDDRGNVDFWFAEGGTSRLLGARWTDSAGATSLHWSFTAFCLCRRALALRFELQVLLLTELVSTAITACCSATHRTRRWPPCADSFCVTKRVTWPSTATDWLPRAVHPSAWPERCGKAVLALRPRGGDNALDESWPVPDGHWRFARGILSRGEVATSAFRRVAVRGG